MCLNGGRRQAESPGVPVGVSTGRWITDGDADARQDAVARWGDLDDLARPDFASVNLSEPEPVTVARTLHAGGIAAARRPATRS